MKHLVTALALMTLTAPIAGAEGYREGWSRTGSVYDRIEMDEGTPAACEALCGRDGQCQSWSWARAGMQGPYPQCSLLMSAPTPRRTPGSVTGLAPALRDRLDAASDRAPTAAEIEALRATEPRPFP